MYQNHLATPAAFNASRDAHFDRANDHALALQVREYFGSKAVKGKKVEDLDAMVRQLFDQPFWNDTSRIQGGLMPVDQVKSFIKHWVYVCVTAIRDGATAVPLRVYQNPAKPEEIVDPDDPLVYLLSHPNPWDTNIDMWSMVWIYLECCGNAPLLKVRDRMGVAELWPLPPQWMQPVHLPGKPMIGYLYEGPAGQRAFIPAEDVIPLKYSNPENRFWGLGSLAANVADVNADDKITLSQALAFEEQVLNDIVFTTTDSFDDKGFERFREMIFERYGGAKNKGLPMLLEKSTQVNYLRRPPAEMEYLESSKLTRDRILSGYKIPPILAGIVENANRSNSDAQMQIFAGVVLAPRLAMVQAKLNRDQELIPQGSGRFLKFDNPMPVDREHELNRANGMVANQYGAPNDARAIQNLDPTEWGKYPKGIWELMLAYGIKDWTPEEIAAAIDRRLAAGILGPSGAAPSLGGPGGMGGNPNQPRIGVDQNGDQADPNDPNARGFVGPVSAHAHKHTTDVGRWGKSTTDQPYSYERARVRQLQVRALTERVNRDLDDLTAKGYRILRKYFAQQMDRIIENLPKVFPNLPESNDPQTVNSASRRMVLDKHNARLYPDGTKRIFKIREGEPARLGEVFVDDRCCGGDCEVRTILVRAIDKNKISELDDWLRAADSLANKMKPLFLSAMKAGADMQAQQLDLPGKFDQASPEASDWMKAKDREYWRDSVNATTQSQLSDALAEVMDDSPTIDKLAEAVRTVFKGETEGRKKRDGGRFASSETIARTETNGAYNGGAAIMRKALGVSKKEWISTLDDRVREEHFLADGQVVDADQPFSVGGEELQYPGDPKGSIWNIANCRCTAAALPSTDDDLVPPEE